MTDAGRDARGAEVVARRIDAHQHFWRLDRGDYGWLTPALQPIYRDVGPADLAPLLSRTGIGGTILVQAAPTEAETRYLLGLARTAGFVAGVVGWTDLEAADAPARIAALADDPLLCGLRPMLHDLPDPAWVLRPALDPAISALVAHDLTFDALVRPEHLDALRGLIERYPRLRVVIDHGAKPEIARWGRDPARRSDWAAALADLARAPGVWCKLSGLATEAAPDWQPDDLRPYVDDLLACFGPSRLIWGSDWPVVDLAGGYLAWWTATQACLADLSEAARSAVLGTNAARCYLRGQAPQS